MNKAIKTILVISIAIFGAGVLLINSAQAGVVWFGDKNISIDFDELPFNLNNWAPGMSDVKSIKINNGEDFDINLYFKAQKTSGDEVLADVLTITIDGESNHLSDLFDGNITLTPVNSGEFQNYDIAISFDEDAGNKYQNKTINFDFIITAEEIGKGNGEIPPVVIPGGGGGGGLPPDLTIRDESVRVTATTETSVTITWTTSYFSTSQVIYAAEGEAHTLDLIDNTGTPPKYGYAHTTPEYDTSPRVTAHSVTITGLTPGTTYYYRTVSHASLAISTEHSFTTLGETAPGEEEEEEEEEGPVAPGEEEEEEGPAPGEEEEEEEEIIDLEEAEEPGLAEEEKPLGEVFATEGFLAAIGAMPFNLKVILIIAGIIIIGLIILRLIRRRKIKS